MWPFESDTKDYMVVAGEKNAMLLLINGDHQDKIVVEKGTNPLGCVRLQSYD